MMKTKWITDNAGVFSILAVLLVVGLGWRFGIQTLLREISETQTEIQQSLAASEHAQKKLGRLSEFEKQYELILSEERDVFSLLPESRLVSFIEEIERLAKETNNTIEIEEQPIAAKPKKKEEKKDEGVAKKTIADELPHKKDFRMKISLTGQYPDVLQFLYRLETLQYALDVVSFDIVSTENDVSIERGSGSNIFGGTLKDLAAGETMSLPEEEYTVQASFETAVYLE